MSQSVNTPPFLYRSFLTSPILILDARNQELHSDCSLQEVKKKRSPVLGVGPNWAARTPGSHARRSSRSFIDNVDCFIDLEHNCARVVCFVCQENFSTKAHTLTEPVDVYAEWIDACVAVNTQ
ncbi:hypothetical protein PR202_gb17778 [Eleusine coracana subsp. coracana]|uniref:Transcription elongation factor 1 homolog n=1 Tax=Eleusine coracana subsp. coracana TaxID=191504 RepID=A0AAV5F1I1_ELECO|nr:hypothetical protein PR202_gb17778 [Eleusine coracana subsp. coracana]